MTKTKKERRKRRNEIMEGEKEMEELRKREKNKKEMRGVCD